MNNSSGEGSAPAFELEKPPDRKDEPVTTDHRDGLQIENIIEGAPMAKATGEVGCGMALNVAHGAG